MTALKPSELPPEVHQFLLEQAGGRQKVLQEFYKQRVRQAAKESRTLAELLDEAKSNDWLDALTSYSLKDLGYVLSQELRHQYRDTKEKRKRGDDMREILRFIQSKGHDGATQKEIKIATDVDGRIISQRLFYLQKEGLVRSDGAAKKKIYYSNEPGAKAARAKRSKES